MRWPKRKLCCIFIDSWLQIRCLWNKFSPNQLLCQKIQQRFLFVEETFENEKDQVSPICRYRMNLGDFRHRCTMKLKVYINRHENGRKSWKGVNNMWMNFSPTCHQKPECQCSTTIYCQHKSIFHRQKKLLFVYLTGQNWGLSRLKNMWQVIMTGDVLSVILNIVRWN